MSRPPEFSASPCERATRLAGLRDMCTRIVSGGFR